MEELSRINTVTAQESSDPDSSPSSPTAPQCDPEQVPFTPWALAAVPSEEGLRPASLRPFSAGWVLQPRRGVPRARQTGSHPWLPPSCREGRWASRGLGKLSLPSGPSAQRSHPCPGRSCPAPSDSVTLDASSPTDRRNRPGWPHQLGPGHQPPSGLLGKMAGRHMCSELRTPYTSVQCVSLEPPGSSWGVGREGAAPDGSRRVRQSAGQQRARAPRQVGDWPLLPKPCTLRLRKHR